MVRPINRLSALKVKKETKPGRYSDGGGLYLLVKESGKSWIFRWRDRITGKLRDKGLGPAWDVSLEEARVRAAVCRQQLRDDIDPIAAPREARQAARAEAAKRVTFAYCLDGYLAAHAASWRNAKHSAQWRSTLETYADALMPMPVAAIEIPHVMMVLEPIWSTKTETATRVRQRIEAVLGWATVSGFRSGDNPAAWRGRLDTVLASPAAIKKVEAMAALPHREIGGFMAALRRADGLGARALELQILTAMRPGAVATARWSEFDFTANTWTIPGARMKTRLGKEAAREHVVPLPAQVMDLLKRVPRGDDDRVFPGVKDASITTAAMLKAARAINPNIDAHGFRSTFRDWCADCTAFPGELAELALAHTLKDKTEAAYLRTKQVEKRRALMVAWASRCGQNDTAAATVTNIKNKPNSARSR